MLSEVNKTFLDASRGIFGHNPHGVWHNFGETSYSGTFSKPVAGARSGATLGERRPHSTRR